MQEEQFMFYFYLKNYIYKNADLGLMWGNLVKFM